MSELAANTPTERADALIRLIKRLTVLIEEETAHFRAREPHKAIDLQVEKTKLGAIYRKETQLAAKTPARLEGLDEIRKSALREAVQAFESALRENGRVVEALKVVTEGLVKALADEAARLRQAEGGYGPNAARGAVGAMAYNQTA